ncbi:MAG: carboxypeptidase regulatory-like domain-containing protein, partial [Blastocatellia bacterium]|nr:carboxypeptidase regulatory-like domain-containing protein [Blastocatellia bacterium]
MKATTQVPQVPHLLWMKLFLLAVCLQIGQIGFGQTTSQLTGTVTDQTGAVIPRADITLKSDATGDVRHTVSNSEGYFAFAAVPAGSYTVIVESTGFARWERKGVVLNPGDK